MRKVTLTFEREYGGWPYRASTEVEGAPDGVLTAGGPDEEYAVNNLRRVFGEWSAAMEGYPKVVEVDW